MLDVWLTGYANCPAGYGVYCDVPISAAGHDDLRWELVECATMVGVAPSTLEAAKIGIVH